MSHFVTYPINHQWTYSNACSSSLLNTLDPNIARCHYISKFCRLFWTSLGPGAVKRLLYNFRSWSKQSKKMCLRQWALRRNECWWKLPNGSPYHWLSTSAAALQREFHASSLIVLDWKELLIKKIPAKAWLCQGRSQLPRTMFQCNTFPFQLGVSSSETPFPWIVDRSYCVCLDRGGGEDVKYGYESFTTGDKGGIEKNNMGMKLYIAEYR